MSQETTIADRLRETRKQRGLTQEALGAKLGLSKQAISHYERGVSRPAPETIDQISDLLTVSRAWLYTGEGSPDAALAPPEPAPAAHVDVHEGLEEVSVPYFGGVGAGDPRLPAEGAMVRVAAEVYALDFGEPPRLVGGAYRPHDRYGYFTVYGDSAAPVYFSGERLPVQTLAEGADFVSDLLYVFRWDGMYQLKRLRRVPGGGVVATSLNPGIEPFSFHPAEDDEEFAVVALARAGHKQQLYTSLVMRFLRLEG